MYCPYASVIFRNGCPMLSTVQNTCMELQGVEPFVANKALIHNYQIFNKLDPPWSIKEVKLRERE